MTIDLALEYIPRRMAELGINDNYYMRMRHLILKGSSSFEFDAYNEFIILVENVNDVNVTSDAGAYDLGIMNVNELQYEHQGSIKISNYGSDSTHFRFLQIIPKNKSTIKKENSDGGNN